MSGKTDLELFKNGKRIDGRKFDELRDLKITAGVLKRADGSCLLEWGKNKVLAAVYGPRECMPRHEQNPLKARIRYRYNMAPFSVEDRKRPGPDRRSTEISKISQEAFEKVIFTNYFPKASIDIFVEILQADAGTRCAALTAASVALADAGIPMKDLIVGVAAGKAGDQVILDLGKEEDNFGQADMPMGIIPTTGEVVLMQMDGDFSKEEFNQAIELIKKAVPVVYEKQRQALKDKYEKEQKAIEEDIE